MKALVLIDVQNDFIDGALGSEWAQATVPKIAEFVKAHPEYEVFATRDTHYNETSNDLCIKYEDSLEGKRLPVKHCIKGTKGWELNDLVKPLVKDNEMHITDKPTFMACTAIGPEALWLGIMINSALTENFTLDVGMEYPLDEIVVCGFVTSICVLANALYLRGLYPNTKITVLKDLCADVTTENHEMALKIMEIHHIDVKESQEITIL